jgi:ABC-type multidrug transport system ATPase subunit
VSGVTDRTILEVDDVSVSFGPVEVLSELSLSIPEGKVIALVGPNGSGKTTLIRTVVGDVRPDVGVGSVTYRGPSVPRPIGYLPQDATFRSGFTAEETLAFYGSFVDGAEPTELLERVGLEDAADRRVEALSGGMRQLLAVAQATVGDPPLVVLDEPASGLDPVMSTHVFETVAAMAERGATVLVSSHEIDLVEEYADDVAVIASGEIVERGSPTALRQQADASTLRDALLTLSDSSRRVTVVGET